MVFFPLKSKTMNLATPSSPHKGLMDTQLPCHIEMISVVPISV